MSLLNLTTIIFNLDGTLQDVINLEGKDLNLCPGLNYEKNKALRFGVNMEYRCEIDAQQFFNSFETNFFIPYLQYWENDKSFLYAIPILIKNIGQNEVCYYFIPDLNSLILNFAL